MSLEDLLFFAIFLAIALHGALRPWLKRRRQAGIETPSPVPPQPTPRTTSAEAPPSDVAETLRSSRPERTNLADEASSRWASRPAPEASGAPAERRRRTLRRTRSAEDTRRKPAVARGPFGGPRNLAEARRGIVLATVLGPCLGTAPPLDATDGSAPER